MRRGALSLLGLASMMLATGSGHGAHNEPQKAAKLKGDLVTAYEECVSPNLQPSEGYPVRPAMACAPPVRSDPQCGFGPKGAGKFAFALIDRGLRVTVTLAGLDAGCEGQRLRLRVTARATTQACAGGVDCTIRDDDSSGLFPARPCLVVQGKCKMGGEMNFDQLPSSSIQLPARDIRIERAVNQGFMRTFEAGVLLPPGKLGP